MTPFSLQFGPETSFLYSFSHLYVHIYHKSENPELKVSICVSH